jgi:hypothetical protein
MSSKYGYNYEGVLHGVVGGERFVLIAKVNPTTKWASVYRGGTGIGNVIMWKKMRARKRGWFQTEVELTTDGGVFLLKTLNSYGDLIRKTFGD